MVSVYSSILNKLSLNCEFNCQHCQKPIWQINYFSTIHQSLKDCQIRTFFLVRKLVITLKMTLNGIPRTDISEYIQVFSGQAFEESLGELLSSGRSTEKRPRRQSSLLGYPKMEGDSGDGRDDVGGFIFMGLRRNDGKSLKTGSSRGFCRRPFLMVGTQQINKKSMTKI